MRHANRIRLSAITIGAGCALAAMLTIAPGCGSTKAAKADEPESPQPESVPAQQPAEQETQADAEQASADETAAGEPNMVRPEDLPQGFLIVADDPQRIANASDPISIGTIWGGWDPSRSDFTMTPRSDSRWQLELNGAGRNGRFAFKFTRGNWDTVELTREGEDMDNRLLPEVDANLYADGSKPVFEFTIAKWADQLPSRGLSVGVEDPNVELAMVGHGMRLQLVGGAGRAQSIEPRDAIVWLPQGYDAPENADRTYPVLYMMDGQNLFQAPANGGRREWLADETMTALTTIREIQDTIVVGIPHAGGFRADEYLPLPVIEGVQPSAPEFLEWLEFNVIPRVEGALRVRDDAQGRYIGGASFGGIIALYAATERTDLFGGGVIAESPSLLVGGGALRDHFLAQTSWPTRVFIGMGGREAGDNVIRSQAYADAAEELGAHIVNTGVAQDHVKVEIVDQHEHNELAWSERFPTAMMFMLPDASKQ